MVVGGEKYAHPKKEFEIFGNWKPRSSTNESIYLFYGRLTEKSIKFKKYF